MDKVTLLNKLYDLGWTLDELLNELYDHDAESGELVSVMHEAIGKIAVVELKLRYRDG